LGDSLFESICIVNSRGQIILPKAIRDYKKIKPGDKLAFRAENRKIIIEKIDTKANEAVKTSLALE